MEIFTEGVTFADAIEMARDAIGAAGISMEDSKGELPSWLNYEAGIKSIAGGFDECKEKYIEANLVDWFYQSISCIWMKIF